MYLKQQPMSYKVSSVNNNNKRDTRDKRQAPQPFCKVCFDAKRPDYNTHFLKDFTGSQPVVLCPYLLALTCNYCKEQGHTVSYCEILKAKKAGEAGSDVRENKQHQGKVPSQNGHFFIMRVSKDGDSNISSHTSSSRSVSGSSSTVTRPVSTTNQFALLEDDDEGFWEQPKQKGKKAVSFATIQEAVAVAVAAEPESVMKVEVHQSSALPTWAKIVAMPPPKKQTPSVSAKDSLKKEVKSLFVSPSSSTVTAPAPAPFEKPMPVFIHHSTETKPKDKSIEKYFFAPPSNMSDWADDSSEEDGW